MLSQSQVKERIKIREINSALIVNYMFLMLDILDVTAELEMVKKYYHELRGSPDGQTQM